MGLKKTQNTELLDFMRKHKLGITSMQAYEQLGITRLSARIYELRDAGHKIATINESGKNRYGHTMNYARYVLER